MEEKRGWQMVWAGVGLLAGNCLLGFLFRSPETFGLSGILYYAIVLVLCAVDVVLVYCLVRKFFRKKK